MSVPLLRHLEDSHTINLLAFVGGYVDAAGYLKLKTLFTSSITGNVVVACTSVSGNLTGVVCRACVTISFIIAGFISALLALKLKLYYRYSLRTISLILFSIEIAFLIMALILGLIYEHEIDTAIDVDNFYIIVVGCALSYAMGAHSVAAKESFVNCPPTTVMTNTLINVSGAAASVVGYSLTKYCESFFSLNPTVYSQIVYEEGASDAGEQKQIAKEAYAAATSKQLKESIMKFYTSGQPLFNFIFGSIMGALIMYHGNTVSLVVPLFIVSSIFIDIGYNHYLLSKQAPPTDKC
jgi:uncharacterized membrane protein YoaK (UPF0700 family)